MYEMLSSNYSSNNKKRHKLGMAVYTCNPNTWETEAGGLKVQGAVETT
jgi:hypothetical protein